MAFGKIIFRIILSILVYLSFVFSMYAERLPIKTYSVADGLLGDTVYKIKQDSRGFLWLCTGEGISRFDGYAFMNFTANDGLPNGGVNDFLETRHGTIYLAAGEGLARLNPNGNRTAFKGVQNPPNDPFFTVVKPDNPKAQDIKILYEDRGGRIWVGTSDGLYKLDETNFRLESVRLGPSKTEVKEIIVSTIVEDRSGALWIGTNGSGIFRISADGVVEQFTVADGLPDNKIASLLEDRDGQLWVGMRGFGKEGLLLLDEQVNQQKPLVRRAFTRADGLPSHWIPGMYQASDGKLWFATTGGLCEWQGADAKNVCRTYTKENNLCDADVWSVTEDKDGNLWIGSRCGAKKLARYGFTSYGERDGIETLLINSIFENKNGELFATIIAKGTHAIYRFSRDGKFTEALPNLPGIKNYVGWGWKQTVLQDSTGAWLIPTTKGLFKFAPESRFENLARAVPQIFSPTTRSKEIFRNFEDSRGDIWIATWGESSGNELWRWERAANRWQDFTSQVTSASSPLIMAFVEDQSGNLWIGTGADDASGELIRYRDGKFTVFTGTDGVPNGWIRDLYIDKANRLWIANSRNGLLRLDDVNSSNLNLIRYSVAEGLSSTSAYCVTEDSYGRIYAGGPRGVDRLNPTSGQIETFTTADGLPASYTEVAYREKTGDLWFSTANGLTKFTPEPKHNRQPPKVLVTALRVNGEPQSISIMGETEIPNVELNAEQKQVSIDFVGLGASLGENLKYEYRLGKADWIPTNQRTVNFANLPSGNYRFEVRTVSAERIYSEANAVVTFNIAAPIYLRSWFFALMILAIALVIFAVYRYRLNKLLEIERTRTRIATDLHDDIGTNLTKISLLSEIVNLQLAEQNTESARLLNSIAEISRESVGSMSDIVWAINPKRDSVLELVRRMRLHVEEIFLDKNVRVRFEAPEDGEQIKLSMDARRELYLIFKEAVSNAAKHSDCKNIGIDFRLENSSIFLNISDDGKGFEVSGRKDGNGLENMRSRTEKNGGKFEVESSTGGTILKIRFPQN